MKKIGFYIKIGQAVKDKTMPQKAESYLEKARYNLETLDILNKINNQKIKELLKISQNYEAQEWIVITGYYAMYSAALSLIAKIGFRSKNHSATIAILEEYFVKRKILDEETYLLLKNASLKKEEVQELSEARQKREIAQYSITKQTTKEIAEKIKKDAYSFVNKCEEIIKK
ncbi:hypothetical protein J4481_02655 [Candidatus Pacearchaeota archaeon]|nr:hypothetical protein [Candidatus Pacearchaeota archaeon]